MIYAQRFQELCRRAEQERDAGKFREIRQALLELLQEEELALALAQLRNKQDSGQAVPDR